MPRYVIKSIFSKLQSQRFNIILGITVGVILLLSAYLGQSTLFHKQGEGTKGAATTGVNQSGDGHTFAAVDQKQAGSSQHNQTPAQPHDGARPQQNQAQAARANEGAGGTGCDLSQKQNIINANTAAVNKEDKRHSSAIAQIEKTSGRLLTSLDPAANELIQAESTEHQKVLASLRSELQAQLAVIGCD